MSPKIKFTKNYNLFMFSGENREQDKAHIMRIAGAMQERINLGEDGYDSSFPIICIDKGKYEIGDGQHRFQAAVSLGIGVYYMLVESIDPLDTILVKPWRIKDYSNLHSYRGNDGAAALEKYVESYGIPHATAAALLQGDTSRAAVRTASIRDGGFVVTNQAFADKVGEIVKKAAEHNSKIAHQARFVSSVAKCVALSSDKFSFKRLKTKVESYPKLLVRAPSEDAMLSVLERIYNVREDDKFSLAFEAKNAARAKSAKNLNK